MQAASNGSMSSAGRYGNGYYGDPSVILLSNNAATGIYGDMLLQPSTVCYDPSYTADGSSGAGCKQSYYHQEGLFKREQNSPPSSTSRYLDAGGHHPGRAIQTPSSSSSPSAAAAAVVAEASATTALRPATSYPMLAVKPSPPTAGTFSFRGPTTADGYAAADRLAAGALAAAAADFVPTSVAGPSSGYVQPNVGLGKVTSAATAATYGPTPTAPFHLSSESTGDGSCTSFHGGLHGFQPTANGFLSTAGTSAAAYSPFQKLQTPWTTSRMAVNPYSSLDICKFPV